MQPNPQGNCSFARLTNSHCVFFRYNTAFDCQVLAIIVRIPALVVALPLLFESFSQECLEVGPASRIRLVPIAV